MFWMFWPPRFFFTHPISTEHSWNFQMTLSFQLIRRHIFSKRKRADVSPFLKVFLHFRWHSMRFSSWHPGWLEKDFFLILVELDREFPKNDSWKSCSNIDCQNFLVGINFIQLISINSMRPLFCIFQLNSVNDGSWHLFSTDDPRRAGDFLKAWGRYTIRILTKFGCVKFAAGL